jgi:hypothetical protein
MPIKSLSPNETYWRVTLDMAAQYPILTTSNSPFSISSRKRMPIKTTSSISKRGSVLRYQKAESIITGRILSSAAQKIQIRSWASWSSKIMASCHTQVRGALSSCNRRSMCLMQIRVKRNRSLLMTQTWNSKHWVRIESQIQVQRTNF